MTVKKDEFVTIFEEDGECIIFSILISEDFVGLPSERSLKAVPEAKRLIMIMYMSEYVKRRESVLNGLTVRQ